MRVPEFFVAGAPRCGTTTIHGWLRQHPGLLLPASKSLNHLGSDIAIPRLPHLSRSQYLDLFDGPPERMPGEVASWYLFSRTAASEIREMNPRARIVAMLRNPVDQMASLHRENLALGKEHIEDFEEALAAEPARRDGRRIRKDGHRGRWGIADELLWYRYVASYAEQIERYQAVFGADRLHAILFDDLVADPAGTWDGLMRFLGADPGFVPRFEALNSTRVVPVPALREAIEGLRYSALGNGLRRLPAVHRFGRAAAARLTAWNTRPERRGPVEPGLRARLVREIGPAVEALSVRIGRDLSAWMR